MPVPVVLSCVAETYDRLSHPNSFTLGKRDVFETLQQMMKSEDHQPVKEGNVGYVRFTASLPQLKFHYSHEEVVPRCAHSDLKEGQEPLHASFPMPTGVPTLLAF